MADKKFVALAAVGCVVVLLVGAALFHALAGVGQMRAQSEYTGHVVDVVEDKGVVYTPSWVNMKTSPRSSDIQQYCIPPEREEELLVKFYDAMESGDRYTVEYARPFWVSPFDCKGNQAIVTDIRPVNATEGDA